MRVVGTVLLSMSLFSSIACAEENTASATTAVQTPSATTAPVAPQVIQANRPVTLNAANQPNAASEIAGKPLTAEQIAKNKAQQEAKTKALVKDQESRLQQLEKANLDALSQNQELQLKNDNLGVQVQVLQSERSAQMFLYGATTLAVGVLLGFLIASYVYTKRRRQW